MFISCLKFKDIKGKDLDSVLGIRMGFLEVSSDEGPCQRDRALPILLLKSFDILILQIKHCSLFCQSEKLNTKSHF